MLFLLYLTGCLKILCLCRAIIWASQVTLSPVQETRVLSLGPKDPLEKGMATHCNILALRIPWTRSMQATVHGSEESDTTEQLTHTHTHTHTTFITTIPEYCQSFHSSYVSFYYFFHELSNFHIVFSIFSNVRYSTFREFGAAKIKQIN